MKLPQRLLMLEDSPDEAFLLRRHLAAEWPDCEIKTVDKESDFVAALGEGKWDAILSDFRLPDFSGMGALRLAQEQRPEIPFLFVSGAIGDEVAVESLKAGAIDYVLKDRIARLVPAIRRALNEAEQAAHRKRVEEELKLSEERYRDLFENAMDLIQSVTPDGRFLYVNRAWRETLGYSEAEVANLTIFDVVHPEYLEQCRERFQGAEVWHTFGLWEVIFLTKFGHHLYVEGNTSARFNGTHLEATRGIFRDVTEKRLTEAALKRSNRQYEALVHSVDGVVWQASQQSLQFTFVSSQSERLLGYPAHCWLEEENFWQNHIHAEDRERMIAACRGLNAEKKYESIEYRMLAADGRVVWMRGIVTVHVEEWEAPQLLGIMVDITSRKQAEIARLEIQGKLEETNKDLLRKNDEIRSFYHTLSHELKTPLTSAIEFVSILMDGLAGPVNPTQLEYLGIARDSCNQLRLCINDLLDGTRLETGKLRLDMKPLAIGAEIHRVVTIMGPQADKKKIKLIETVAPDLPLASFDQRRIVQVITNLVSNAIKYTSEGGEIVVSADKAPKSLESLRVSVRDTGRGIPPDEQEKIFERLYQVRTGDATTEQGVGLGLYLCRELVHLHGGAIQVESAPGKGSNFSFTLPIHPAWAQSNLLVIEDDPETRTMLRDLLAAQRYNVRTAADGFQGLEEMRRQTPDIVLLDLAMPNLDGASTLKEIRHRWGPLPVIVHTAFSDGALMKKALPFSPFTLLAKPCAPNEVIETVRKVERSADTAFWKKTRRALSQPAG